MTQPAISKHLKVLERAGLVSRGRDAQRRPRRLEAKPLEQASKWLEKYRQYWEGAFQRLDALLDEMQAHEKSGKARHGVDLATFRSINAREKNRPPKRRSSSKNRRGKR
jgi:DNA-binding MarR family transcriptional regulator